MTSSILPKADDILEKYTLSQNLREGIRRGLIPLLEALNEVDLTKTGRVRALSDIHDDLRRMHQIWVTRVANPEIADVQIERPLFIIGLPRCGTSLLQALMSSDPSVRTPLMWEVAEPIPPPTASTFESDSRIKQFDAFVDLEYKQSLPALLKAHPFGAEIPQECGSFMRTSFHSSNPVMSYRIPRFYDWLLRSDLTFRYEVHKMWLQHLTWKNPRRYIVLKIQEHMYALPELTSVYPDATFVQLHRNPATVIASISQLIWVLRSRAFANQDLNALGLEMLGLWHDGVSRTIAFRHSRPNLPIFDLRYTDLTKSPLETVRTIYERCDWEFTDAAETGMSNWLTRNPAGKHGIHQYTLEDFGLNTGKVLDAFSDYISTYRDFI